jgi:hypothetical protein
LHKTEKYGPRLASDKPSPCHAAGYLKAGGGNVRFLVLVEVPAPGNTDSDLCAGRQSVGNTGAYMRRRASGQSVIRVRRSFTIPQ